ncbi:hypothetical protein DICSQDRAFT_148228 [Dichomitus squalens LYAD-421 SS1]|uniref:Transmembrane protein n=1 Tax=Dichomitus squalens (strain LYAD-421) TaxID=732165 RepID=R7SUZ9_DICSQ|nr:uncharacterized protein DICSQDRAFT_148228 [Dichomitus squalens LYAD-421 SS1]EJF59896.1 hypothetical protein DICSQDRAFT_148228 [Dichomitus squalens LYAD-421 SS1]
MSDFLSLSVLQLLSVLSFLTSVLAVVCVGSGSFHRLAHRVEHGVDAPAPDMSITSGKHPIWNWSGLPVSFSLDTLIGEDEEPQGYVGGTELTRMDWQVTARPRIVTTPYESRVPMSMAKLIMTRHSQRRPTRQRRIPGMPRQTTPRSRLAEYFA